MRQKILQLLSEKIYTKYYFIEQKWKNYFSEILTYKNNERGAFFIPLLIGAAKLAVVAGAAIYAYNSVKKEVQEAGLGFFASLVVALGLFLISIGKGLFGLASSFLNYVLGSETIRNTSISSTAEFVQVWISVKDISNIFIVLGFVVIGIATALRLRDYEAKKLLQPLIIVAILINFSGLFCGLIIDATNIITNDLLKLGGAQASWAGDGGISSVIDKYVKTSLDAAAEQQKNAAAPSFSPGGFLALCAFLMIFLLISAYIYAVLAILLTARFAALAALYILSPLAFFCTVFPQTHGVWKKWIDQFLQWAFVGVITSFFLLLANRVLTSLAPSGRADIEIIFVAFIFLYMGYKTARSGGAAGAAAVTGLAAGAGMLLAGGGLTALKGGAKMADKLTGGQGAAIGRKLSTGAGLALERLGLRKEGTTRTANQEVINKDAGLLKNDYDVAKATGDKSALNRIYSQARKGSGARGAAAMKVLADAGDLGDAFTGPNALQEMSARLSYAESAGAVGVRGKAEKLDPRLRGYNKGLIKKFGGGGAGALAAINDGYSRASVGDIREFSSAALKDVGFTKNISAKKIAKAGELMSNSKIQDIKSHLPRLRTDLAAAKAAGNTAEVAILNEKITAIDAL